MIDKELNDHKEASYTGLVISIAELRNELKLLKRGYFILIACVLVVAFVAEQTWEKQGSDEHSTCQVQSVGLEASKHLANIMIDIDVLIAPPDLHNPYAKELPKQPPIPKYYKASLVNLRAELPAYSKLEKEQPNSRKC